MVETSGQTEVLSKFNLNNLPLAGTEWVGKFFNRLWEEARDEKIDRLQLHTRFMELHDKFRGRRRKNALYPIVGANYIFKTVQGFCAMLTEKDPMAEFRTDDDVPEQQIKALNKDTEKWWQSEDLQKTLYGSVQNMQVYGTTIEKYIFDTIHNTSRIILRDPFNFFPAPGYTMCTMRMPYCCDAYFLHTWDIRQEFEVPEEINIPADADEQLFGRERETTRGGLKTKPGSTVHNLPKNYATVSSGDAKGKGLQNQTLVVEVWVFDRSIEDVPVMGEVQATFDDGSPAFDDQGRPVTMVGQVGTRQRPRYPGGIRKVTICPALMETWNKGVLDDDRNPNVNWKLVEIRKEQLLAMGLPVPAVDETTGQPIVDPATGQQAMQAMPVDEKTAEQISLDTVSKTWLFSNFPFSAVSSLLDTTQWWGFSIIEQIEELTGKAESILTKYFAYLDRLMFPILINPQGSGVDNKAITNAPGLIIRPTVEAAPGFGYINPPTPPQGLLDLLQFVLYQIDVLSQTPEVTEGRKPKGVSAASAIIALQDKAATLFGPQRKAVDSIIVNRGRAHGSFVQNFGTKEKPIKVDKEFVQFLGINLQGAFDFYVESGSTAPITKTGRRQQYIELFRIGALGLMPMLEMLEIPSKAIEQTIEEKSVPGALNMLIQAGLPPEIAQEVYQMVMQNPGIGGGGGPNGKPGEGMQTQPTGPNAHGSERMNSIYNRMSMQG